MKKIMLVLASGLLLAACNSAGNEETATTDTVAAAPVETAPVAEGPKDPVCEMTKDVSWTEYTVYENDTVWFCSETCKGAFVGNPAKYVSKPQS